MGASASMPLAKSNHRDALKDVSTESSNSNSITPDSAFSVRLRVNELETQVLSLQDRVSKDAAKIQELEAQVQDLQARLSPDSVRQSSPVSSHLITFSQHDPRATGVATDVLSAHSVTDLKVAITSALRRKNESFMREVFDRHADSKSELSSVQLIAALQEVDAPMLLCEDLSSNSLLRRADANLSGAVDFSGYAAALLGCKRRCVDAFVGRFMRAAVFPDELEMFLIEHDLRVSCCVADIVVDVLVDCAICRSWPQLLALASPAAVAS